MLGFNQRLLVIKKRIVRCVIKEVIVDIDEAKELLNLVIHWQGGTHTAINVPRPMSVNKAHKTSEADEGLDQKNGRQV